MMNTLMTQTANVVTADIVSTGLHSGEREMMCVLSAKAPTLKEAAIMAEEAAPTTPLDLDETITTASLNELFLRDPRDLTKPDRLKIIERLRAERKNFITEEAAAKAQKRRPKYATGLSLDDLGGFEDMFGDPK